MPPLPDSLAAIIQRIDKADVDLILVTAPAGFGKTTFATRLAATRRARASCDVSGLALIDVAKSLLEALATESPQRGRALAEARASSDPSNPADWQTLVQRLWVLPPSEPSYLTLDNVEAATSHADILSFIGTLLSCRPSGRRVILCSRSRLPNDISRHALPHRTEFIGMDDLRLSRHEVLELFRAAGAGEELADEVFARTAGWPIAVQLMRRLEVEGRLTEALRGRGPKALDALIEYMSSQYLDTLSPTERKATLLSIAIPNLAKHEASAWARLSAAEYAYLLRESPLLRESDSGQVEPHPLLRSIAAARYGPECSDLAKDTAAACQRDGDALRAGEIFLSLGDRERAAACLANLPPTTDPAKTYRLLNVLSELDSESIISHPSLWLAASEFRRFAVPLEQLLDEARRVYYTLPHDAPERQRSDIAIQYSWLLLHGGKPREAKAVIEDALEFIATEGIAAELRVVRLSLLSMLGHYLEARAATRDVSMAKKNPRLHAQLMDFIEATTALRSGEYERGISLLEETARLARHHGLVSRLLISLSNLAFEAWYAGDDERLARAVAEIRAALLPGFENAWHFWLEAVAGDDDAQPTGFEAVTLRTIGFLFLASSASGTKRVQFVRRAVAESDISGDVGLRVISRIAAAEYDPEFKLDHAAAACDLAASIDIAPLRNAVLAYARQDPDLGALQRFVELRLRRSPQIASGIVIELVRGKVFRDGHPVDVSTREFALVALLAVSGRAMHRDSIADALWPDLDADAAANNLRVVVHKLRKKLGDVAILSIRGGYGLGADVSIDLSNIESLVHECSLMETIPPERARALRKYLDSEMDPTREELLRYNWYVSLDHRLAELRRTATLTLAKDAYARGAWSVAQRHAGELMDRDATDECACEIMLRTLLRTSDLTAARRQLNRFLTAVAEEGDELAERRMRSIFSRELKASPLRQDSTSLLSS